MRWAKLTMFPMLLFFVAANARANTAHAPLTSSDLPQFLANYEQSLAPIDAAYAGLMNQPWPMRDDAGRRVGRREIKDRQKIVADLRNTAKELAASPEDLVLALTLLDRTEKLGDDLYDLSQIAYDNDLEEPAMRLTEFLATLNDNQDLIEGYVFSLARDKEGQLRQLHREIQEMRQKLQGTEKPGLLNLNPDTSNKVENTRLRRIFNISQCQPQP
jgi:hypothetical protein